MPTIRSSGRTSTCSTALDASLLPPDNELKKWSLNGYIKQLPWDSAIIARFTQSKLTNNVGLDVAALDVEPQADGKRPLGPGATARRRLPADAAV